MTRARQRSDDQERALLHPDAELFLTPEPFLERVRRGRGVVDARIVEQDAARGALVKPPHVGPAGCAGHHDGDAVERFVVWMEGHGVRCSLFAVRCSGRDSEQRIANSSPQQYRSNAWTRSDATDSALRPSIWCRWTKCTTSPSLSSANDGLEGWYSSPK